MAQWSLDPGEGFDRWRSPESLGIPSHSGAPAVHPGSSTDVAQRPTAPVGPRRLRPRAILHALRCATQGLCEAWRSQPNLRMHVGFGAAILLFGALCRLSLTEWLWVVVAVGLVIFAELMNTAIERTVDLVVGLRPDPLARHIKDVAAGCVLIAALLALIIECIAFLPHLVQR